MKLKVDIEKQIEEVKRCKVIAKNNNDRDCQIVYQGVFEALTWMLQSREDKCDDITWDTKDELEKFYQRPGLVYKFRCGGDKDFEVRVKKAISTHNYDWFVDIYTQELNNNDNERLAPNAVDANSVFHYNIIESRTRFNEITKIICEDN